MAKILQILDINSDGHRVRLDDGRVIQIPHGHGEDISVGADLDAAGGPGVSRHANSPIPPSIEHLNSPAQVEANILSEIVQPHDE